MQRRLPEIASGLPLGSGQLRSAQKGNDSEGIPSTTKLHSRVIGFVENRADVIRHACIIASITVSSAAMAAEWTYDLERGLDSYTIAGGGGTVVLVCDSDHSYNPDKSYANFVVRMPIARDVSQLVFLAETGEQAAFVTREGVATQQNAKQEEWANLIEMAKSGGRIAVVTEDDSFTVSAEPMPNLRCD